LERVRAATEMLEALAENGASLAGISVEERARLLQAAGQVYCPDVRIRRRFVKNKERQRKAERQERQQAVLAQTGIRKLRQQPVFTTPNVFPPKDFLQQEVTDNPILPKPAWISVTKWNATFRRGTSAAKRSRSSLARSDHSASIAAGAFGLASSARARAMLMSPE